MATRVALPSIEPAIGWSNQKVNANGTCEAWSQSGARLRPFSQGEIKAGVWLRSLALARWPPLRRAADLRQPCSLAYCDNASRMSAPTALQSSATEPSSIGGIAFQRLMVLAPCISRRYRQKFLTFRVATKRLAWNAINHLQGYVPYLARAPQFVNESRNGPVLPPLQRSAAR